MSLFAAAMILLTLYLLWVIGATLMVAWVVAVRMWMRDEREGAL